LLKKIATVEDTERAQRARRHATIVVEKLNIQAMIQNRHLVRHIADAGRGRLVELLRYKLAWGGGQLVEVPAAYRSKTCSACGHVDEHSRSAERFSCVSCAYRDHADLNAAKVLKTRYQARANRSCLPMEGSLPESSLRSGKIVRLRVPRRSAKSSALPGQGWLPAVHAFEAQHHRKLTLIEVTQSAPPHPAACALGLRHIELLERMV
jgi:hypothetical protein